MQIRFKEIQRSFVFRNKAWKFILPPFFAVISRPDQWWQLQLLFIMRTGILPGSQWLDWKVSSWLGTNEIQSEATKMTKCLGFPGDYWIPRAVRQRPLKQAAGEIKKMCEPHILPASSLYCFYLALQSCRLWIIYQAVRVDSHLRQNVNLMKKNTTHSRHRK